MRQAALQLKNKISNVSITNNNVSTERIILQSMLMTLGGLALLYVLILGNMVFDIVERRTLEKEAQTLNNEVGELELVYFDISNDINVELATTMGFSETEAKFATRRAFSSISRANDEI